MKLPLVMDQSFQNRNQPHQLPARVLWSDNFTKITPAHEAFEKCSILFKFKEDENFNQRNTLSILRIKI